MAVLAEGISVVVRFDSIARLMDDDWSKFVAIVPNQTLCCDNELARVGFMAPTDVEAFVRTLEAHGFRYVVDGKAVDLVVVDQQTGPAVECDWVECAHYQCNEAGEGALGCRLVGGSEESFFAPEGWQFEGSLSQKFGFQPTADAEQRYRFLRNEGGIDVYLDTSTGTRGVCGGERGIEGG